jgi:diguanylate cyclase (GGDEF)-like protein/PAS domain S-box-containing protein
LDIRNEQFYRALVEHSPDAILILGADLKISFSTLKDLRQIGMPAADPVGVSLFDCASEECRDEMAGWLDQAIAEPGRVHRYEFVGRERVRGGRHYVAIATNLRGHPAVQGIVINIRDVTTRKLSEMEAQRDAMYDGLTGLARREFFAQQTRKAIARAIRHEEVLAMMFVDIDGFKEVNDALGHGAGDRLLKDVGARLRDTLREDDSIGRGQLLENEDRIARLGGDEFTVMLTKLTVPENAALVAQRMLAAVAAPYSIDNKDVRVTVSIGIAVFPQDGRSAEELLRSADKAMYAAKKLGKNTYTFHSQSASDAA